MKYAISLGTLNPKVWRDAAVAADELGFDAVFASDHLVFPQRMDGTLHGGTVPASTPLLDGPAYLSYLAGITQRVRLGTFVYLLGLRHPFIGARAFATLDVLSGGRALAGVGVGWLTSEWEALGIDPKLRGARLDEAIAVCRRLWSEPVVEHRGAQFQFEPVMFEPKPAQTRLPILVGGEAPAALRRAATLGDGWMGMAHTPASATEQIATLRALREQAGRADEPFEITVMSESGDGGDAAQWTAAGVDRLVVKPWNSSRDAIAALQRFAADHDMHR